MDDSISTLPFIESAGISLTHLGNACCAIRKCMNAMCHEIDK